MRDGWTRGNDLRPHYTREIVSGPLTFHLDVWQADMEGKEFAYAFQGRNSDEPTLPSAEKAIAAAELTLASHLRRAAKLVGANDDRR